MPLVDRCDEIVRLIDDALRDAQHPEGATTVPPSAAEAGRPDGRWRQRVVRDDPSDVRRVAA
ncbi:MAG TPA: hypothetical protein VND62_03710 [Acidimicrobiales bacterium]|nr:hypothetical protein [Acidimicrobiales bacterium]